MQETTQATYTVRPSDAQRNVFCQAVGATAGGIVTAKVSESLQISS